MGTLLKNDQESAQIYLYKFLELDLFKMADCNSQLPPAHAADGHGADGEMHCHDGFCHSHEARLSTQPVCHAEPQSVCGGQNWEACPEFACDVQSETTVTVQPEHCEESVPQSYHQPCHQSHAIPCSAPPQHNMCQAEHSCGPKNDVIYQSQPYQVMVPVTKTVMVKKVVPAQIRKVQQVCVPVTKMEWRRVPVEKMKKVEKTVCVPGTKTIMVPKTVQTMKSVTKFRKVAYVPAPEGSYPPQNDHHGCNYSMSSATSMSSSDFQSEHNHGMHGQCHDHHEHQHGGCHDHHEHQHGGCHDHHSEQHCGSHQMGNDDHKQGFFGKLFNKK